MLVAAYASTMMTSSVSASRLAWRFRTAMRSAQQGVAAVDYERLSRHVFVLQQEFEGRADFIRAGGTLQWEPVYQPLPLFGRDQVRVQDEARRDGVHPNGWRQRSRQDLRQRFQTGLAHRVRRVAAPALARAHVC